MKIRNGFVSNSSSSSFVIVRSNLQRITDSRIKQLLLHSGLPVLVKDQCRKELLLRDTGKVRAIHQDESFVCSIVEETEDDYTDNSIPETITLFTIGFPASNIPPSMRLGRHFDEFDDIDFENNHSPEFIFEEDL